MYSSAKVKCLIVDDEPIARSVITTHLKKLENIEIIAECSSAVEAFGVVNKQDIDLMFLDINMPEMSGLSFMKTLGNKVQVIFTTAHREYAIDGFELEAVDFLLKPISFDRLLKAINKYYKVQPKPPVTNIQAPTEESPSFFVRSNRKMVKVNTDDILYIESLRDYEKIHSTNDVVITKEQISALETMLPNDRFIRIHRSFIVALQKIDAYTQELVEINERELPISRSYKNEVMKRLEEIS